MPQLEDDNAERRLFTTIEIPVSILAIWIEPHTLVYDPVMRGAVQAIVG